MSKRILVVDDEEGITRYLGRVLRNCNYTASIAMSGAEAKTILAQQHFDLIISDMRMPEMSGFELLSYVKQTYPHIIRIILSGDSDRNTIIKAVANGTARSYLTKPISNDMLKSHLDRLFMMYDSIHTNTVAAIIDGLETIPVIPVMYQDLCTLINQNKSMEEIAQFISNDPEYAVKILHIANSSMYGIKIGAITQALVYLGLETIKNLIFGTELFRSFAAIGPNQQDVEQLWEHSRIANRIFHGLYRNIHNAAVPDEYACCGLLHDTGTLLVIRNFPDKYKEIQKRIKSGQCSIEQAETRILGVTHMAMGAYLLDWWNLPQSIIETCMYHHEPLNPSVSNMEILCLVHIADYYSWKIVGRVESTLLCEGVFEIIKAEKAHIDGLAVELSKEHVERN